MARESRPPAGPKAPRTQKVTFTCPGEVVDRKPKQSIVKLNIDPGPRHFLAQSKARQSPVSILLTPDEQHREISPISLFGIVKGCCIEFEDVSMAPDRIADLEFLMREKNAVVTVLVEGEWAELFDTGVIDET